MDIKTGEVLACVSTPSFDTNKFAFGITQPEFNELLKNERKPLINKFLSGQIFSRVGSKTDHSFSST